MAPGKIVTTVFSAVYFDWEHAMFGSPVFYNTDRFQKSNDLFWLRLQAYF